MTHITKESLEDKSIEDLMKNNIYEVSKNRNFKLFCLEDKYVGPEAYEKLELIAYPEKCKILN